MPSSRTGTSTPTWPAYRYRIHSLAHFENDLCKRQRTSRKRTLVGSRNAGTTSGGQRQYTPTDLSDSAISCMSTHSNAMYINLPALDSY